MIKFCLHFLRYFLLIGALFAASSCKGEAEVISASFVNPNGSRSPAISLEVADQQQSRATGLMYRKAMPAGSGMLFIFPDEKRRNFWMKNTYLELDIIYLDSKGEVIHVISKATPLTETPRDSVHPAQYAVEVLGGLSASWGIVAGSKLELPGEMPVAES